MPSVANLMRAQIVAADVLILVKRRIGKVLTNASAVGGEPVKKIIVEVPTKHGIVRIWVTQANAVIKLILLRLRAMEIAIAEILAAT